MPSRSARPAALWSAVRDRTGSATREIAMVLSVVLLVGLGAAQDAPADPVDAPAARPVAEASSLPAPVVAGQVVRRADRPVDVTALTGAAKSPASKAPRAPVLAAPPPPRERWLPSGTGMWLHDWHATEQGHAKAVVARAQAAGLTHLYVQTGSSKKGWIGEEVLSQLMPAVEGTGISVIAWDFPKLDNPESDARRLARAAFWNRKGAPMISAVAPDVETGAEGTKATPERVRRYYAALRKELPQRTAILATVPWPSEKRIHSYPYGVTAPWTDAFVPMAYWYNRSPSTVTQTSMTWLARYGKPVMPVGQGYDGRLDAPYLKADLAPDKSVAAFAFVARRHGARSLSLWSWQTTGPLQWGVLAKQRTHYAPTQEATRTSSASAPDKAKSATEKRAPGRQHKGKGGK